jgi:hypothetical protein
MFLNECFRVSKEFFITTPNRWFFVETHTAIPLLHWLPMNVFRRILRLTGNEFLSEEKNLNLFSKSDLNSLVKSSDQISKINYKIRTIKTFFWPSNLILHGCKAEKRLK